MNCITNLKAKTVVISHLVLKPTRLLQPLIWNDKSQEWLVLVTWERDQCDTYAICGAYGTCSSNNVMACDCFKGFTPKSPSAWEQLDRSGGCRRKVRLDCNDGDGFIKSTSFKLPYSSECIMNKSMTLEECRLECLKNCSCTGYNMSDTRGAESGSVMWFEDLLDFRDLNPGGQDLYLGMAESELGICVDIHKRRRKLAVPVFVSVTFGILLSGFNHLLFYLEGLEEALRYVPRMFFNN